MTDAPAPRRRPPLVAVLLALCLAAGAVALVQRRSAETQGQLLARHRPAYAALAARLQQVAGRLRSVAGGRSELPAEWKAGPGAPLPLLARSTPGSGTTALLPIERLEDPFGPRDADPTSTLEAGLWLCRPDRPVEPGDDAPAEPALAAALADGLALRYLATHAATVGAPGAPATLDVWLVDLGAQDAVRLHRRERVPDVQALERQRLPTDFRTRALLLLDAATGGQVVPLD